MQTLCKGYSKAMQTLEDSLQSLLKCSKNLSKCYANNLQEFESNYSNALQTRCKCYANNASKSYNNLNLDLMADKGKDKNKGKDKLNP